MIPRSRLPKMFLLLGGTLLLPLVVGRVGVDGSKLQRVSRAHFEFCLSLYRSLATVLSMLFLGAGPGSNTSLQLREVLHYTNLSYADVHSTFKSVLETFEESYYQDILHMANKVYKQTGVPLSPYYQRAVQEFYKSTVDDLDFAGNEESAREQINRWISQKTDGKITDLVSHPLPPDARLVLVNALALKASWLYRFDEAQTFDKGLFYITYKKRFEIPMMIGKFKLPLGYSPSLECRVLELPFQRRRVSLFILLPDDLDRGLSALEGNLTSDNIKALFSTLKDEIVNIRLPRFKSEFRSNMVPALREMGLSDIFLHDKSDLSAISEEDKLYVSGIAHKTTLEIREEGAEATAATSAGLERLGTFGEKYFEVDHAFLFFIWDYHSGSVLFMGRVVNPTPILK